jgi:hypothetical protein
MTQNFVRYSRDVEKMEPDFERSLQAVLDDMKQHMRGSLKTEGIGLVVRNAHAKGYGLARGEFEILGGMPSEYAQGIYAKPGRHEAMVRFSNGTTHVGGDQFLGPITGIGLKIFGIEGKTLLEDEPDSQTFDYALINHPVFFVNTLAHYIFIQSLFANAGRIVSVLRETKGRISGPNGAAVRLGVKRSTLLDRMKRLGINAREVRNSETYVTI